MKTARNLLYLIPLLLLGCSGKNSTSLKYVATLPSDVLGLNSVYETTIENCEYLVYDRSLTHKGNCTNLIHYYNK